MSLSHQQQLTRIIPFLPLIFSAGVVMANTASQQQAPLQNTDGWLVIIGGLVTFLLEYQRRRIAEQNKAIKTTQETTPDLTAFITLRDRVNTLEARNSSMTTQLEMLLDNYKAATAERDRIRQEYSLEQSTHEHTRSLLQEERNINSELSRTIDRMESKIADLERRIEKAESVNDLAKQIVNTMKELLTHKTDELPKVSPA